MAATGPRRTPDHATHTDRSDTGRTDNGATRTRAILDPKHRALDAATHGDATHAGTTAHPDTQRADSAAGLTDRAGAGRHGDGRCGGYRVHVEGGASAAGPADGRLAATVPEHYGRIPTPSGLSTTDPGAPR